MHDSNDEQTQIYQVQFQVLRSGVKTASSPGCFPIADDDRKVKKNPDQSGLRLRTGRHLPVAPEGVMIVTASGESAFIYCDEVSESILYNLTCKGGEIDGA